MSGIYLHIPYCKQKCHYCNFYSVANKMHREEIVPMMMRELKLQKDYLEGASINTIYFGGGTPSLLSGDEISLLLSGIQELFHVEPDAEITLEANPDDLTPVKIKSLIHTGINRLSIGIQSFSDQDLVFLNRVHSGKQAKTCIKRAQDAGFTDLSIDLIYGIPTLSSDQWEYNLMTALDFDIPHISAYALTVEDKTPLAVMIRKGKMPDVNDAVQLQHFEMLLDLLNAHGYQHYEISNFCLPGKYARHNTSYWKGIPYLGIGPSAHSFNGESRQWNVSGITPYIQALKEGKLPFEKEVLSQSQKFNEYIMTSLRTIWGCDLSHIEKTFGKEWLQQTIEDASIHIKNESLTLRNDHLTLSKKGKFRADGIAADFFRV
ncbi:MAG: radical SAM family heme chaperone HemW [Bacteroidales bacterium]|nr:radical SAM family heme chaperone HemW [Bacteroidales bacterium]